MPEFGTSVRRIGKQGNLPGQLDRAGQHALVLRGGAGDARGYDLAALGDVVLQHGDVFVVDMDYAIYRQTANLRTLYFLFLFVY